MNRVSIIAAILTLSWGNASAQGRAIPIEAEENVIASFKSINPDLEYDRTNFLVDLSGRFASCININHVGFMKVNDLTQEKESIQAIVDSTRGQAHHVSAVVDYVKEVTESWVVDIRYAYQISRATKFGCSVRPGCRGLVSVACLFSPSFGGPEDQKKSTTPFPRDPTAAWKPRAQAFTPQQYSLAELITDQVWDREYELENLSGSETDCEMIETVEVGRKWEWNKIREFGEARNLHLSGRMGYEVNAGSTEDAMVSILQKFKGISATKVGCSLIPDCPGGYGDIKGWNVVISCVYKDEV